MLTFIIEILNSKDFRRFAHEPHVFTYLLSCVYLSVERAVDWVEFGQAVLHGRFYNVEVRHVDAQAI